MDGKYEPVNDGTAGFIDFASRWLSGSGPVSDELTTGFAVGSDHALPWRLVFPIPWIAVKMIPLDGVELKYLSDAKVLR